MIRNNIIIIGTGDEEQRGEPTKVEFEHPFCATEISAGEQHSLASGREGAYAWGSNSMGQLGMVFHRFT
jgi:alpha-tubulin suppressor-like RCC1 family protein